MNRLVRAALLSLLCLWTAALAAEDVPTSRQPIAPGSKGVALTTVSGTQVEELPLTFIGTYKNFAGPGYDLHLVQLEGELADRLGVASGMSGSPVYIEGELVGALSYRMGSLPKVPIAGVTPIETMLEAAHGSGAPPVSTDSLRPIGTPIVAGGLNDSVRAWLEEQLDSSHFQLVAGGGQSDHASPSQLQPGSPVGVELVRGDLSMAATGTVTWIEDEQVYAFGHPFLGSGRIEMPMVSVEVLHTLADLAGSTKLSNVGQEIGAFLDDRLTAIVGRTDMRASMIPVRLEVQGASYGSRSYRFEIVKHSMLTPLLTGVVVANAMFGSTGYDRKATVLASGKVRLQEGLPELELDLAFAGDGSPDPALAIAGALQQSLATLWTNRFEPVEIQEVELQVRVAPEIQRYRIESLHYDRGPLQRGETLEVECRLSRFRGGTITRKLLVEIPETLPPNTPLVLAVGSPAGIERVTGQRLALRTKGSSDLRGVVAALNERRASNRLTAALFRQAPGVITRGTTYEMLPPTAARLLGSDVAAGRSKTTQIARLSSSEIVLDGPVDGGKIVRLRLDNGRSENDGTMPGESRR